MNENARTQPMARWLLVTETVSLYFRISDAGTDKAAMNSSKEPRRVKGKRNFNLAYQRVR
jgi:hypothetical protein